MQTVISHHASQKVIYVDVMVNDRFIFTLRYEYCPLFKIDLKDIHDKVIEKRPTLKNKKIEFYIC